MYHKPLCLCLSPITLLFIQYWSYFLSMLWFLHDRVCVACLACLNVPSQKRNICIIDKLISKWMIRKWSSGSCDYLLPWSSQSYFLGIIGILASVLCLKGKYRTGPPPQEIIGEVGEKLTPTGLNLSRVTPWKRSCSYISDSVFSPCFPIYLPVPGHSWKSLLFIYDYTIPSQNGEENTKWTGSLGDRVY